MDGLLGNLFGIQEEDPLLRLLPPEQRQLLMNQAREQGTTNLGLALLQAGGPTTVPGGFGQRLGQAGMQAMQANQGLMDKGLERLMAARKLQQEQEQLARRKQFEAEIPNLFRTQTVQQMDEYGRTGAGIVQPENTQKVFDTQAAMNLAMKYPELSQTYFGGLKSVKDFLKGDKIESPYGKIDPKDYTAESIALFAQTGDYTQLRQKEPTAPTLTNQRDAYAAELFTPQGSKPVTYAQLTPKQMAAVNNRIQVESEKTASAGVPSQKPEFRDAAALRNEWRTSTDFKAFQEMKGAYQTIEAAASTKSPVSDVALATKMMKLLDPGSVVRESELAIAMNAAAPLDRVLSYANRIKTGEKLTDTQRQEFRILSQNIYKAAEKEFKNKENYYGNIAKTGGLDPYLVIGEGKKIIKVDY